MPSSYLSQWLKRLGGKTQRSHGSFHGSIKGGRNHSPLQGFELLEDRTVPATFFVGLASNYTITNNVGPAGLSNGDTVTWNGSTPVSGLIFGTQAFSSVSGAVGVANNHDTIRIAANTYSDGNVGLNRSLTFDIPAGTSGFSLNMNGSSNLNLTLTGDGSVPVSGNNGNNVILGNNAANTISGSNGSDTIRGGRGNDSITGGNGIDMAEFTKSRSNYVITVVGSTVTVQDLSLTNNEGTDTLVGVERISFNGDVVRAVPTALNFAVGTPSAPLATSLVFGEAFVNTAASGNHIEVTLQLDQGSDSDGNFIVTNNGNLNHVELRNGGKELVLRGNQVHLNNFLNSGSIQYQSRTGAQRLVKLTSNGDHLSDTGWTLLRPNSVPPVFTSSSSLTVTYGQSVNFTVSATSTPPATFSVTSGSLPAGITLNPTTGLLSGSTNAGTYAFTITASNGTQSSSQPFTLVVNPAALTVTADAKTKVYGDADPTLTFSVTAGALFGLDGFVGSLSRAVGENVGTYAISQGTLSAGSNYNVTFVGANLTVTQASLSIAAVAQSKVYGDADPALTYTVSGLKNGDTASVVTGALTRVAGENVGTYAINQGSLSAGSNYNVAFVGANLAITPAALTVTAAGQSKVYGDADPALTYTVSGLKNGDTASVVTGALTRVAGENVGTYAISQGTVAASSNYDVTFVGANLAITPAALTVTADAKSKVYGDADPALTYTVSGLKNGDTASVVTGALTRVAGENVGTYAISQGTVAASSNYDVTFVGANLNITKRLVSVTATAFNKNFDGNVNASAVVSVTGLPGDDLTATFTTATFDTPSVGFEKTVTINGLALSGAAAGNYELANSSTTALASIIGSGVVNGNLVVVGTGIDDEIIIAIHPRNASQFHVIWRVNGTTTYSLYNLADVGAMHVYGMDGNDKLTMNAEVPRTATLFGNNGNDILRGGNFNDTLYGGEGNDFLYGSLADDYLDGGTGSDTLFGQDGNDTLIAGVGDTVANTLDGGNGADLLIGAEGDDTLTGGGNIATDGADTIHGNGGNDRINGGNGDDLIHAGDGNDIVDGGNGNDTLNGGNGNDTLNGNAGDDLIQGDAGDDLVNGGDGNDTVHGGEGNDIIHALGGDDSIHGGEGNNTIQGGDGNDTITAGHGNNFILGQNGNDTITVGNGNNIVVGGLGNDLILAGNGTNLVIGGGGLDNITVGQGSNIVIGSNTAYDASESNLRTIHNEWLRTDISGAQKRANLSVGVNGVRLVAGQTVHDDLVVDQIFAGSGDNWLWV